MSKCPQYFMADWWLLMGGVMGGSSRSAAIQKFVEDRCVQAGLEQAPASTYRHGSFPGGLVDHMCRVAAIAQTLQESIAPEIPLESVMVSALFHDMAKLGMWHGDGFHPRYVVNSKYDPTKPDSSKNSPYTCCDDALMGMTLSEAPTLVLRELPLTYFEMEAIRFHDGQYVGVNEDIFKSHKASPLTLLLHFADMWALQHENDKMSFMSKDFLLG